MNKMKVWQGSYGVFKYDGIVSPAYFVFNFNYDINRGFSILQFEANPMLVTSDKPLPAKQKLMFCFAG